MTGVTVPLTESLQDCFCRISPLWTFGVVPRLLRGETVLVVAHANSIRALIKHIDGDTMSLDNVRDVTIPSAIPLIYDFEIESEQSLKPLGDPTNLGMRGYFISNKELIENVTPHSSILQNMDSGGGGMRFVDLIEKGLPDAIEYGIQSNDALIITDTEGEIIHSNTSWDRLPASVKSDVIGKTCKFLNYSPFNTKVIEKFNGQIHSGLPTQAEVINRRTNGKAFVNKFTILPVSTDLLKLTQIFRV